MALARPTPVRKHRRYNISRQEAISFYLMIAPWALGFLIFQVYIFGSGFVASLTNLGVAATTRFVGLKNYIKAFTTDQFFSVALTSTLKYTLISVTISAAVGLGLAVLLNQRIKGRSVYRTIIYLPMVVPIVSATLTWGFMYDRDYGILNAVLHWFGLGPITWLTDPTLLWSLIAMSVWSTVGGTMIVLLAGIQGVPVDLQESAAIDGAGPARRFRYVTLPLITPALFFNIVTGLVSGMQMYAQAELLTRGSANSYMSTMNFVQNGNYVFMRHLANTAFIENRLGYSSALSWILFVVIVVITTIVFGTSKYWVYYESMANQGGGRADG